MVVVVVFVVVVAVAGGYCCVVVVLNGYNINMRHSTYAANSERLGTEREREFGQIKNPGPPGRVGERGPRETRANEKAR